MNPKIIISFISGAATGIGGSFIFLKKHFEKKTEREIDEIRKWAMECKRYGKEMKTYADEMYELSTGKEAPKEGFTDEEIRDYISQKEKNGEISTKINRRKPENEIREIEESYDSIQEALVEKENNDYLSSLIDYTQFAKQGAAYEHPNEEPGVPTIELITALEYDRKPTNDKVELSYYSGDDILCYEETEEVVENPEELIGEEALFAFGSPDYEDPNEIFVRNNLRSIDYRVISYDGCYQDLFGEI